MVRLVISELVIGELVIDELVIGELVIGELVIDELVIDELVIDVRPPKRKLPPPTKGDATFVFRQSFVVSRLVPESR